MTANKDSDSDAVRKGAQAAVEARRRRRGGEAAVDRLNDRRPTASKLAKLATATCGLCVIGFMLISDEICATLLAAVFVVVVLLLLWLLLLLPRHCCCQLSADGCELLKLFCVRN